MDLSLNKEQVEITELVRDLVNGDIKHHVRSVHYMDDMPFDWTLLRKLGEQNLVCPTIPREYGGLGLSRFTTALVIEEIAAGCPGLAAIVDTNVHAVEPLLLAGNQEQKERFLPLLTGTNAGVAAFALTEASGGSDIDSMTACASRNQDGFLINGEKAYVLNAPIASFISLFAITDPTQKKSSMRAFIVPANTDGCKLGKKISYAGLNYARGSSVIFEDAQLGFELGIKEQELCSGYLLLGQTLDLGRALVGATSVGIARAAYETASEFADTRVQFGKKIRDHQVVAHSLVDMAMKIEMARLMTWKACWLIDQGGDYTAASAMAKVTASVFAQEVTVAAADLLAARGYERGTFIEQLVRDARVLSTIEGTNNILKNLVATLL
ncbi:MAG: acyl-CoA dehydrogenase family protein [Bacillota bacterium]|nr:acyl-CoA dehydrogenase family protein [Bacillota bacterium]